MSTHFWWVSSLRKTESVLEHTLGKVRGTWRVKMYYWVHTSDGCLLWEKTESVLENTLGKVRGAWRVKIKYITFKNWIMYGTVYCTKISKWLADLLYSLRNSFLPACMRYWTLYCLMYWTLHCTVNYSKKNFVWRTKFSVQLNMSLIYITVYCTLISKM